MKSYLIALAAASSLLSVVAVFGAEDESFKDLKATIALQGKNCDQIVSAKRNGDSDYLVSCKDGNRYHVFVNAKGRVIVEKQ